MDEIMILPAHRKEIIRIAEIFSATLSVMNLGSPWPRLLAPRILGQPDLAHRMRGQILILYHSVFL